MNCAQLADFTIWLFFKVVCYPFGVCFKTSSSLYVTRDYQGATKAFITQAFISEAFIIIMASYQNAQYFSGLEVYHETGPEIDTRNETASGLHVTQLENNWHQHDPKFEKVHYNTLDLPSTPGMADILRNEATTRPQVLSSNNCVSKKTTQSEKVTDHRRSFIVRYNWWHRWWCIGE